MRVKITRGMAHDALLIPQVLVGHGSAAMDKPRYRFPPAFIDGEPVGMNAHGHESGPGFIQAEVRFQGHLADGPVDLGRDGE